MPVVMTPIGLEVQFAAPVAKSDAAQSVSAATTESTATTDALLSSTVAAVGSTAADAPALLTTLANAASSPEIDSTATTQPTTASASSASTVSSVDATAIAATNTKPIEREHASRRPSSSVGANASPTQATPAPRGTDPLARLIESAQAAMQSNATPTSSSRATTVTAGRLQEVEQQIARERMQRAVEATNTQISIDGESQSSESATARVASATAQTNSSANAAISATSEFATAGNIAPLSVGAMSSGPAAELLTTPASDAPPAAQLAAKGAHILASQRGGSITMRLEPPALGQLRIELHIAAGSVTADFTAATPQARVLLEANLGMLRERLESQGLTVERITVHGGVRAGESSAVTSTSQANESRQDGTDARERSDRGQTRQDAAGGQSRGRRDDEQRRDATRTDAHRMQEDSQSFAGVLNKESVQRGATSARRAG